MTSPTPEERAEAPRHIFTFRIDGQLDPITIKACSQIQGTSTGIKWIVDGPLGKAIASAIREAVEAEREACAKICEDELKRIDMVRHGTRKPRDLGIEWVMNAIRSRSEKP